MAIFFTIENGEIHYGEGSIFDHEITRDCVCCPQVYLYDEHNEEEIVRVWHRETKKL